MRWLKFAALNVMRNRRRSLVAIFITALGTAALLLAGGFALYTYDALERVTVRESGHLVVGTRQHFELDEDVPLQHGLDDAAALQARLAADSAVRHVLPRVEFSGLVSNGEKSAGMMALGLDAAAELRAKGPFLNVVDGAMPDGDAGDAGDEADGAAWVLLGAELARSLKASPGGRLTLLATDTRGALRTLPVRVLGVVSTGVPELDRRQLYTDLRGAQRLLGSARVSTLQVFLGGMEEVASAQARLQARLPGLVVRSWEAQAGFYESVRALYHRIFGVMGLVIGVIVVVVVANAMASAVVERTREIGTLRALGTLPGQLLRALALEGLILGGGGALLGAVAAVTVSALLQVFPVQMPPPPGRSVGYPLQIDLDPLPVLNTVLLMALLATLASAWVARRTVRKPIVEALAHL
ncbi:FtsX-like permease family protein [uncultured Azohydromonas sp.]|jgi:ABC-type transport system, involved in lipoprotein release, permease component|uniref:ABC transporter permease n=1 Tax=uncultured Azohydromonas sp. TaxID=487342 RepID=UPI00260D9CCD|nr:FtsX-like permease family protein [uncultured Azohydromonas sp.]